MKKFTVLFFLFCFSAIVLTGCHSASEKASLCRVVTQVDIDCQHQDVPIRRHYTDTQKMEWVLLYLRLLKPMGKPKQDPDTIDADVYLITVHYSDGSQNLYKQKDHRYFSKGTHPWQTIDPGQAADLYDLMRHVPSDPDPSVAARDATCLHKSIVPWAANFV